MNTRVLGHRLLTVAAASWVAAGCGGEARSQAEIPEGGAAIVDGASVERPTLMERDGAVLSDLLHGPEANERARIERERVAAEAEEAEEERALRAVREPSPLPRYTTRAEPEPADTRTQVREPLLVGTDGSGQIVEATPADDLWGARPSEAGDGGDVSADLEPLAVPAGAELELAIESELSTERSRPGDHFYATLVDDYLAADGLVLLAQGTRLRGVVTESAPSEDAELLPVLEFVVDALMLEESEQPISSVVLHADVIVDERDSGEETAVKVITGAAAGAILGRILGSDKKDAVKGGVAGAAAGAALALGTRGGHARLEPGARIIVQLERRLIIVE